MRTRILYTKPSITDLEVRYAADAAAFGWGERCYEYISRFEKLFCSYLGVKFAIATSSCTGALHLGLAGLGIGPGDEVILADINWIATVAPVTYLGATPVLVDIVPASWCIDPVQVESAVTTRTKAIVATHIYGNLCDMEALLSIGTRHGIPIVEDAAEALGSQFQGNKAGSMGRFGVFSFHGTKMLTTGEGGMFVTNDAELYEAVLTLSNHGRSKHQVKQFWPDLIGFKYKMSNIQAAIGCAQMERIEQLVSRKREIFKYYDAKLRNYPQLRMNPEPQGSVNAFWMPTVVFAPETGVTREQIQQAFSEADIDARVFFWPLSSLELLPGASRNNHVAADVSTRAFNLPSYHDITDDEQDRVVQVLRKLIGQR